MYTPKPPKLKISKITTLFVAFTLAISAGVVSFTQVLQIPDQAVTNWYYDHAVITSLDKCITVIAIDNQSESVYGNYDSWSRSLLADAVTELSEQNAAVIGLDLDLSEPSSDKSGDTALANACATAGNVVAVANAHHDDTMPSINMADNQMREIAGITYPYPSLLSEVNIGIANATQQSTDGFIRNAALTVSYGDTSYDSFAVAVYKAFQDSLGRSYNLPNLASEEFFGFNALSGKANCNILPFSDLLSGNYDASLIDGNIILIGKYEEGASRTALQNFINPWDKQQEILLQASIIQSLLSQRTIVTVSPILQAIFYAIFIGVLYLVIAQHKIWFSILACFLLSQVTVGICFLANTFGYRFPLLVPMLFAIIALILALLQRYIISVIERKKMERTLKMYVEPQVVDELTGKLPFELSSVSERRHIAVLFVDIRGFTTISESLEPEQVVEILNEYLTVVADAIQHWEGTLDKFIGDAAMAFFNAPKEQEDYILRAVCAAEDIIRNSHALVEKFQARYGKAVNFGIGINCGEAIVGNIGSMSRMDYTAIGDTVNTASRLESNAKAGQILVSEDVWENVKDCVQGSYIGSLTLKGKAQNVEAYQITTVTNPPKLEMSHWEEFIHEKAVLYSKIRSIK